VVEKNAHGGVAQRALEHARSVAASAAVADASVADAVTRASAAAALSAARQHEAQAAAEHEAATRAAAAAATAAGPKLHRANAALDENHMAHSAGESHSAALVAANANSNPILSLSVSALVHHTHAGTVAGASHGLVPSAAALAAEATDKQVRLRAHKQQQRAAASAAVLAALEHGEPVPEDAAASEITTVR
jgi:hypothetical protein